MATVFMKWLEQSPASYDRGIQLLTLGKLKPLQEQIAQELVQPGDRVLEIGFGTGSLALLMGRRGAEVTGIDGSGLMLDEAQVKVRAAGLEERVKLQQMDAAQLGDRFEPGSFDLIVATLFFSEIYEDQRRYVLAACKKLLAENGRLIILDEVLPQRRGQRILYSIVRWPLVLITWLLTHTSTHVLRQLPQELAEAGFAGENIGSHLGGSLLLFSAALSREAGTVTADERADEMAASYIPSAIQTAVDGTGDAPLITPGVSGRVRHQVTLRTLFIDLWTLFFRLIPPYPKVHPGLYAVGEPGADSPVLVTGNFDVTVRRVVRALDGRQDVWLLVADSGGINVWCAAGGGHFTAEKIIAVLKSSNVGEIVNHHALILPQLAANGVDGWKIRQETGWGVHWGPVRAQDIPAYLGTSRRKSDNMRWVKFPLADRLEMTAVMWAFYVLLLGIVFLIFWRPYFWPAMLAMTGLCFFYGIFLPWIPGHDGLGKGLVLAGLTAAGLILFSFLAGGWPVWQLWNWILGLGFLAFFTGAEFQGMSPLMRGEQANWGIEALVGLIVLAFYFLPRLAGVF